LQHAFPLPELTYAMWDHTVLTATRQRWHSCLYPAIKAVTRFSDSKGM